ncbi:MAG: N-acetylmuramoyl-L-alanine amidase [Parvularculaceae bacterium]
MRINSPSPNFDERGAAPIDILLLHYTGMRSAAEALARLCDVHAKVSAHYMIDEDGTVFALVPEDKRAWHAGVAFWRGARDINARSIGIELVNPGHEFGYRAFPRAQILALLDLSREIVARHGIAPARVLGHSDVAPARKTDPGEKFPWGSLARAGIGLAPETGAGERLARAGQSSGLVLEIQKLLASIGYNAPETGVFCSYTECIMRAFQRHYRPQRVDGVLDAATLNALTRIAAARR